MVLRKVLGNYYVRKTIYFVVVLWAGITLSFLIPRLTPGDPVGHIVAQLEAVAGVRGDTEFIEAWKARFGLDQPIHIQYVRYIQATIQGDLGISMAAYPSPVFSIIRRALPWTIGLLSITSVASWVIGSIIGGIAGVKPGSKLVRGLSPFAIVFGIVPYYQLAIVLSFLFAFFWPIFPLGGAYPPGVLPKLDIRFVLGIIYHATLPAISIVVSGLLWWFLSMRSIIQNVVNEDYVMYANARGFSEQKVFRKYTFRNSLLPQTTGLALSLGNIMTGAVLVEVIFRYPGIGWLLLHAVQTADYTLVQGIINLFVISIVMAIFIIEVLYPRIDPRVKFE